MSNTKVVQFQVVNEKKFNTTMYILYDIQFKFFSKIDKNHNK